jgi:hypothetical protein
MPAEEALTRLTATRAGLTAAEARERLAKHGRNTLPVRRPPSLGRSCCTSS